LKLDIDPFKGQHCETTATGTLLKQLGIDLSEPMLFGLGEGLSYIFWKMKSMEFPFMGGRVKPDQLTQNITKNLGLKLDVRETASKDRAWKGIKQLLDSGKAVGLKLDCYFLEYFTNPIHFAGHYVAMTGYDAKDAYLIDTVQQGSEVKTSLESLALARSAKGSMSSKSLFYTVELGNKDYDLKKAVVQATKSNARTYLNPPIGNITYRGIEKTAREVVNWFESSKDIRGDFGTSAMLMERAGTGGALFRNLYRDFLKEASELTGSELISVAHEDWKRIAADWATVIALFEEIAQTQERTLVAEVSEMFKKLSVSEHVAMKNLVKL
jgi:hypothetical protein